MATSTVNELRKKTDAAWENIQAQLEGMDAYLDRSDAPEQWTTREVLCHLMFQPGWKPVPQLQSFSTQDLPVIEITPGETYATSDRRTMTLRQFSSALDAQRRDVFAYLDTLSEADLSRQARIPLFKQLMGTDEIALPVYVGALYEYHWNDHAGQLAKIRKAVGLPEAR